MLGNFEISQKAQSGLLYSRCFASCWMDSPLLLAALDAVVDHTSCNMVKQATWQSDVHACTELAYMSGLNCVVCAMLMRMLHSQ